QAFTLNLRFPGQYYDAESGLHYNYMRDYDPQTGRYIQSDPIGLAEGINTYAYALANPIKYIDANGQFTMAKDCCEGSSDLRNQVENSCQKVANRISDPKIRNCILKRCTSGHISCDGYICWSTGNLGWTNPFWSGGEINLCLSYNKHIDGLGQWGCVAIHEWAHSCGWDHRDGAEVPGNSGNIDPYECRDKW
ncbi:MAG: RHS repeat-associated core domain-containing protein, partial [Candidatus Contendobacter sp.]|nr:RHS repeat-associated core domain-containing protein [Candidatus Contendobacter sp.]